MDTVELWRERLLHWLAFAITAAAAVLGVGGCGDPGAGPRREASFATDRTLVFKIPRQRMPLSTADELAIRMAPRANAHPQFVASSTNAADIKRILVRVFNEQTEFSGVHREASVSLPPFTGTLVLRAVRPGKKLVKVEAFSGLGVLLFSGAQVVDFTPGSSRFVEFLLFATPPASSATFRGGPVTTDLRFVRSQSPYSITSPVDIAPGASLAVEGGVEILFETPADAGPDILVRGRLVLGTEGGPVTVLRRVTGVSTGPRIRFQGAAHSSITSADISGTSSAAIEISASRVTVTSSVLTASAAGIVGTSATPIVVGNRFVGLPVGVAMADSSVLVQGNRFTDSTTAVTAIRSSIVAVANVVEALAAAVNEGFHVERSAATISQNRLFGVTGAIDPVTGRLAAGLDLGIVVVDSVSGTAAVSQRVSVDHNTVEGATTAGIASVASDPAVTFNRVLNGRGGGQAGSQGVAINRASATFPKQPLLTSNEIVENTGPAVGFLLDGRFQPGGGGVLGNAGRDGNFVRGNNVLGLGFVPGIDNAAGGTVDGVFNTRTLQVFSVDAILGVASGPIAGAGAPASVR